MFVKIKRLFSKDPVLWVAAGLALGSMVWSWPQPLTLQDIDLRTLGLLFALMAVVAGLSRQGFMARLAALCTRWGKNTRRLCLLLTLLSFFAAMIVTNDVALVTFVPLTLAVLAGAPPRQVIWVVTLQTIGANLGSMATPFGNPQNLYLYAYYQMSLGDFFQAVGPLTGISLLLLAALCLAVRPLPVAPWREAPSPCTPWKAATLGGLLLLCVAAVLRLIPYPLAVAVAAAGLLVIDRGALGQVDYSLLATFCFFFIFVGNLSRLPQVSQGMARLLAGRETLSAALISQAISNVPAALMLSRFTQAGEALLKGVNIGGLGTLIASMASLISFKLYARSPGARVKSYVGVFTAVNLALLALFLAVV